MIVEETIVRQKVAQKDYKEYSDAMLAQAVVARAVEMEVCVTVFMPYHGEFMLCSLQRHRRAEIKQKLEFLAKLEIVEKVKVLKFDPIISFLILLVINAPQSQRHHPGGVEDFDAYDTQALTTRTPSKTLDAHSTKLEVPKEHLSDIRELMNNAMRRKVVSSHPQSPYSSPICSPFFGDLMVDSPARLPHPPSTPCPNRTVTTQSLLRKVKRPEVVLFFQ